MLIDPRYAVAQTVSEAWADALGAVLAADDRHVVNLVLRIADPQSEDLVVRHIADATLAQLGLQEITEVSNTVFPAEWAADLSDPQELAADYGEHLPLLKQLGNHRGTYFGRIVDRRRRGKRFDQLSDTIAKLREHEDGRPRYRSIYEIDIYDVDADATNHRGFPCLSHLGFHIDPDGRLACLAQYRSHDVTAKGYGNYLGLGNLLAYVADRADMPPGELTVVAGGASATGRLGVLRDAHRRLRDLRVAA